jgi:surface carbohydrate biosynthesis protein
MSRVVIFVDSKSRDLMGTALIAHHLESRGVECRLEPLEAWRACVGAWKPDFILFNHLNAKHLSDFTQRCKEWGILIGMLPNEGIFYVDGTLDYNSRKQFHGTHCDRVFCWNIAHRDALIRSAYAAPECIIPVGVPRFDFYVKPWNQLFKRQIAPAGRPVILVNSNFSLAHFKDLPAKAADTFFGQWTHISPIYADYRGAIEASVKGRIRFLDHLSVLLAADKYHVIVRPHPREDPNFYFNWHQNVPAAQRSHLYLAFKDNISELIANCDLEISCENCTTTLEAWICKKPTVGLTFEKHPFFYTPEVARLLPECDDPASLVTMVDEALARPDQAAYAEGRLRHMEKWMYKIDGQSSARVADEIISAITERARPKRIHLGFSDIRRGMKLRLARMLGEPCNVSPALFLRKLLHGERGKQTLRYRDYLKAVHPADERRARELIKSVDSSG